MDMATNYWNCFGETVVRLTANSRQPTAQANQLILIEKLTII